MNRTVLLVDDSKLARMNVRSIITNHCPGWTLVEAADGEQFLACLSEQDVHAALLDVNMPGIDGLEAGARARQMKPDLHLAFITANAQDGILAQIRDLKAAFLPKPLERDQLCRFLSATLLPRRSEEMR